jgi:RNA polymerase sigma-70 factor (ECF subfamily)
MLSDEALYEQLLDGQIEAFDALYRRYERSLFGFILTQLGDRTEAEDVFHDAFVALLNERRTGRSLRSFRAWIFQVARHLCLNRARARRRASRALEAPRAAPEPPLLPEAALSSKQAAEAVRRAVGELPVALAEVYALRSAGLAYEEIARVLKVPVGTVKSRMHELVARLRREVRPWTASRSGTA